MKNRLLCLLFMVTTGGLFAQVDLTWEDLAKISYTEKYFAAYDSNFLYPEFSKEITNLEGKEVTIAGYFLDMDPNGQLFILSKNPLASCFFLWKWGARDGH